MSTTNLPSAGIESIPGRSVSVGTSRQGNQQSLLRFALEKGANRQFLFFALVGSVVQLVIFKLCYPFADFMSDSYNYIDSAANHLNANIWPIGYAKFLIILHQIGYSDTMLITMQYFLLQLSILYFFYTVNYLYRPSRTTVNILFVVLFFNPASLYISNYVLSDALFGSITIVWFSVLLWQLRSPNWRGLLTQVVLMGIAFTIRYTAIYYPLVAALMLLICPLGWRSKIAWVIAPALLFFPFIRFTQLQTETVTGTAEFSVFGGWQIANNALYMYGYIDVDSTKLPAETRNLDGMVKEYFKWAPPGYINLDQFDGTFFIKHSGAPLKQYMWRHFRKEQDTSSFLAWGKVSPLYNKYGTWLIHHYPLAFAEHYLWLNTKNYFLPYLAQMGYYNLEEDDVWRSAQSWFHYPSTRVWSISKTFQGKLFLGFPPLFLLLNVYFFAYLLWLIAKRKFRQLDAVFRQALFLLVGFVLINFGFSILATPVVLRYELVPMLFLFTFSMLLLELGDIETRPKG